MAFLDADDTWHEGHLATLAELAHRHPQATLIGTSWTRSGQVVPEHGQVRGDRVIDLTTFLRLGSEGRPTFWTSAVAVRRSALPTTDLFPVGSRVSEDTHAWLAMMEVGPGSANR